MQRAPVIHLNRDLVYQYSSPPIYDEKNGDLNLSREFLSGSILFNGAKVNETDYKAYKEKPASMEAKAKTREYLARHVTEDPLLFRWAIYNAHMNGPLARFIENIQNIFRDIDGKNVAFLMEQDMNNTKSHVYPEKELNTLTYQSHVVFTQAIVMPVEGVGEASIIKNADNSPIAMFSASITVKRQGDKVVVVAFNDSFECQNNELQVYFNHVQQQMDDYRNLDSYLTSLEQWLKRNQDLTASQGFTSFFKRLPEGRQEYMTIKLKVEALRSQLHGLKDMRQLTLPNFKAMQDSLNTVLIEQANNLQKCKSPAAVAADTGLQAIINSKKGYNAPPPIIKLIP